MDLAQVAKREFFWQQTEDNGCVGHLGCQTMSRVVDDQVVIEWQRRQAFDWPPHAITEWAVRSLRICDEPQVGDRHTWSARVGHAVEGVKLFHVARVEPGTLTR